MIDIRYLRDCNGADRFGTCMGCGKGEKDDSEMARITISFQFRNPSKYISSQGSAVCICSNCRKKLLERLGEME